MHLKTKLLAFVSLPLYLLDQVSKQYIVEHYELNAHETTVIPGFFWIHHTANTGVAFGMFNGSEYANYVFGAISIAAAVLITMFWRKGAFPGPFSRTAAALLYAGIAGNLTDRLWLKLPSPSPGQVELGGHFADRFLKGYVVDFLKFDLKFMMWPSFNVADSCVVVAAVLLAASSFLETPAKAPAAR